MWPFAIFLAFCLLTNASNPAVDVGFRTAVCFLASLASLFLRYTLLADLGWFDLIRSVLLINFE